MYNYTFHMILKQWCRRKWMFSMNCIFNCVSMPFSFLNHFNPSYLLDRFSRSVWVVCFREKEKEKTCKWYFNMKPKKPYLSGQWQILCCHHAFVLSVVSMRLWLNTFHHSSNIETCEHSVCAGSACDGSCSQCQWILFGTLCKSLRKIKRK